MTQLRQLPEARFSCRGCGRCCQGFSFGPVEPQVIQGLQDAGIEQHWSPAAEGPWFHEHPGPGEQPIYSLAHRDGHCVFLREDKLCAVHALLGESAKPWFCREYPIRIVQDAAGVTATVRADCGGFHESHADGAPLDAQIQAALSLPRPVPYPRFSAPHVEILPGVAIGAENWLQLEAPLLSKLQDGGAHQAAAKLRSVLTQVTSRVLPEPDEAAFIKGLRGCVGVLGNSAPTSLLPKAAQQISALLPESEDRLPYFRAVLCNDLLAKRFAAVGSVPAGVGLTLLEVQTALALGGPEHLSEVQRTLQLPKVWEQVRALKPALEALFVHNPG